MTHLSSFRLINQFALQEISVFCDLLNGEELAVFADDVTYKNPYCYKCWENHQNSSIIKKLRKQKGKYHHLLNLKSRINHSFTGW